MNKIFHNKIKGFIRNKKGAVSIEFFFSILLFGIMFAFMIDLLMVRSSLGKLDNASYTLVNLLRERLTVLLALMPSNINSWLSCYYLMIKMIKLMFM